jgi:hypothetical protein
VKKREALLSFTFKVRREGKKERKNSHLHLKEVRREGIVNC